MANISTLNSVLTLGCSILPVAQTIVGFASDDAFATTSVKTNETLIGVDGIMSYGSVAVMYPMTITLQADSPSIAFFESIAQAEQQSGNTVPLFGELLLLSVNESYTLQTGVITNYPPTADGKKLLQPRKFEITFNKIVFNPFTSGTTSLISAATNLI